MWRDESLPERDSALTSVNDAEIGARLRAMLDNSVGVLRDEDEHWSLSGAQHKLTLRREGDKWCVAHGAQATTHIVKPGIAAIAGVSAADQALAEHVTMTSARALGVNTASTEYVEFDAVGAVVIERFDRYRDEDGNVQRLHQEDMCQARGVDATHKYESDGGPSVPDLADTLWWRWASTVVQWCGGRTALGMSGCRPLMSAAGI